MTEFTIPRDAWTKFVADIAKLNRKAKKLNCDPIAVTKVGETVVEREHHFRVDGEPHVRQFRCPALVVDVQGKLVIAEGGEFALVARVEDLSDGKSRLFHTVPGVQVKIDERFRTLDASICEHCHKARRRTDTFIVLNTKTGEQRQVGRNCLRDFTGLSAEILAQKASWLTTCEGIEGSFDAYWSTWHDEHVSTRHALALTSAYIAQFGWLPKSSQRPDATAILVALHFGSFKLSSGEEALCRQTSALVRDNAEHFERADRTIAWIKETLSQTAKSDYEHNLVTLVVNELTERHHLGLVCSAVAAYQRSINQAFERKQKADARQGSRHVGQVGDRIKGVKGTVEFVKFLESQWGPSTLLKFLTDDGNVLTWFAASDRDFVAGNRVEIDGTIKGHREYQGIQETQLTRAKVHLLEEACK